MSVLSEWIRPHLAVIAMALVATILVLYGADLNRFIKKRIGHLHFALRLLLFVLLCSFGYGLLLILGSLALAWLLAQISSTALFLAVVLLFLAIGFLAERKHQM